MNGDQGSPTLDEVPGIKSVEVPTSQTPPDAPADTRGKVFLTKQQILAVVDIEREDVEVPEWGGWVQIRAMTGAARDKFESGMVREVGKGKTARTVKDYRNVRARGCALCIVEPDTDKLMFTTEEVIALGQKSASALDRVFTRCMKISKISEEDVKEIEGNSDKEDGDGDAGGLLSDQE